MVDINNLEEIRRLDGSPWKFKGQGALMTNGLLHDQVLAVIASRK